MTEVEALGLRWREGGIDAPQYRAAVTPRLRHLLNNLHHHHEIESAHYFPQLGAAEPRMAAGFALLDRDHALVDQLLAGVAEAATRLIRAADPAELAPLAHALTDQTARSTALIGRHLWDEEEIVIPVLALRGDAPAP